MSDLTEFQKRANEAEQKIATLEAQLSQLQNQSIEKIKKLETENTILKQQLSGNVSVSSTNSAKVPPGHTSFSWGASNQIVINASGSGSGSGSNLTTNDISSNNTTSSSHLSAKQFLNELRANLTPCFYTHRNSLKELLGSAEVAATVIGKEVTVAGWARTIRMQGGGRFAFIELTDGSTYSGLQIVLDQDKAGFESLKSSFASTGAAISARGIIIKSPGSKQLIEMQANEVVLIGGCDPTIYPLAKKKHGTEYLRTIAHLRPRTHIIAAATRVRNALAYATHKFFQENGFLYVHTPIITASDCEGAGEMFSVTALLHGIKKPSEIPTVPNTGEIDFSKDFFAKPSFLTVSGQLDVETYCSALSKVYTFGPTFRAENSHTGRHLAEFWMIEPEIAYADLQDNMTHAEAYLRFVVHYALENCVDDLKFFNEFVEKGLIDRLKLVANSPFVKITYTQAIEDLQKSGQKFDEEPVWGIDMGTEHERFLTEQIYKMPVIVINYPKSFKAFYMRLNEDDRTVSAMDILVPKIGEIIGGSQREERLHVIERRLDELKLPKESYSWYLDLRRFGSVPHAGFGLGFERLVMFVTGIDNIRDVIPFPRYPGHAEF
eukprot:TRINITY_DN13_c0_g3_i4.p1 TRINITY_DN13_c0_g3~~TRINITY_DN13_c0_g3_i4.p1  ORF type:complete len:606 (+),score=335.86 TRINITY_DN13_c0_g3_i4:217-2034(+)